MRGSCEFSGLSSKLFTVVESGGCSLLFVAVSEGLLTLECLAFVNPFPAGASVCKGHARPSEKSSLVSFLSTRWIISETGL